MDAGEARAVLQAAADRIVAVLSTDARILGVAAAGSWLTGTVDEYSDLDLVIAVDPAAEAAISDERFAIAARLGTLLAAFTGEHVGEPRLLICLYAEPLLHVDLKFVAVDDLAHRVEDPAILWQRGMALSTAMAGSVGVYPQPQTQWIEDRFWVWVHYVAAKIRRGELFEVIDSLGFLRARILGPLLLQRAGSRPSGVRRIEQLLPDEARRLAETVATHDRAACVRALEVTVEMYSELRLPTLTKSGAEDAARAYLRGISAAPISAF